MIAGVLNTMNYEFIVTKTSSDLIS